MKTLYVTDLDGTLLGKDARLSEASKAALDALYEKGVMVSPATSRSWSALSVLRGTRLRGPYVLLGGARLYDAQEKKLLLEHTYSIEDAKFILDTLKAAGLSPMLYTQNAQDEQRIYYEVGADRNVKAYVEKQRAGGDGRFCEVASFSEKLHEKKFIITVRGEKPLLEELLETIKARGLYAYLYYGVRMGGICFLEAAVVSKRVGMENLRRLTGAERIVAFGDNGNDEGLFDAADVCIAMGNATEGIRRRAHRIIGTHDTDAVVRTIFEMEGMQWVY